MPKTSAGILMYRFRGEELQVLLIHPGGPFWRKKDEGSWSIPKGEYEAGEEPLAAARREFQEETGFSAGDDAAGFMELTPLRQPSRKLVSCWAVEGDIDAGAIASNTFSMEWPPHSGRQAEFPEADRAEWFTVSEAQRKILPGQRGFVRELCERIGGMGGKL